MIASMSPEGDNVAVIRVTGELDVSTVAETRSLVHSTISDGWRHLVIDLTECTFMDSAGLGVIIGARRRCLEADGRCELIAEQPELRRVLRAADLDRLFTLHHAFDAAVAEAAQPSCDRDRV